VKTSVLASMQAKPTQRAAVCEEGSEEEDEEVRRVIGAQDRGHAATLKYSTATARWRNA
jgi:hypothetical protein